MNSDGRHMGFLTMSFADVELMKIQLIEIQQLPETLDCPDEEK